MTEREATIEVSFADDGTDRSAIHERLMDIAGDEGVTCDGVTDPDWLILSIGDTVHRESMFTDQGEPIEFRVALELASLHLLARLEGA